MSLTNEQITRIEKFIKKHYVEWYDVQVELIDHLASDIEKIMKSKPNVSFEEALNLSFKKFGAMGFMDIVEKKALEIKKRFLLNIIKNFKAMLLSQKGIVYIINIFIFYQLLILLPNKKYLILFSYLIIPLIPLYFFIKYSIQMYQRKKHNQKVYLVETSISQGVYFIYSVLILQLSLNSYTPFITRLIEGTLADKYYLFYSIFIITFLYLYYFTFLVVPKQMIEHTINQYEKLKARA